MGENSLVRGIACRAGYIASLANIVLCAVAHVATFVTILPPQTTFVLFVAFPLAIVGVAAGRIPWQRDRSWFVPPPRHEQFVSALLLVYALAMWVYFFRKTGGASGADIIQGQYVFTDKARILKTVTEHEYRMLPNLVIRSFTALFGWMSFSVALTLRAAMAGNGTE